MSAAEPAVRADSLRFAPMLIGGRWVETASGRTIEVENPARRAPIAQVPRGDAVGRAVEVLRQFYGGYKQSGIGCEFSLEGMLDSFTQHKNVTVNLEV